MAKIKQIIISREETEQKNAFGIFLIGPKWIHLDEKEIQERLDRGEKLFKVNFGE